MLAPAKINLDLLITGRRDDGYHLLDSLVVFADYGDQLTVECADDLSLEISGPFGDELPCNDNNLILKAARLVCGKFDVSPKLKFYLVKNLPVSSGIGGGSADAAAALRLCIDHYDFDINDDELIEIALNLGADVPVCLKSKAVQMAGIGDEIHPFLLKEPLQLLLVNPGVSVSTPAIFKHYALINEGFDVQKRELDTEIHLRFINKALQDSENSLQPSAVIIEPMINEVLLRLKDTENASIVRMSGSGATCFAVYHSKNECKIAAKKIKAAKPSWWVKAVECL